MSSLFDMNGTLMNTLRKLANIILCNVLFCAFSIPLFTIGAALSAMFSCMQAILADDEDDMIAKQYWNAFKKNFVQSTVLWLLCLAAFAFLGMYYLIVASMVGIAGKIYRISFFMMCIIFLFGFQYLFPLQARYQNKIRNTLKNAWLLSIAALPWTLLSIALVVGAIYISFFMNPDSLNLAVFLWGTLGFGIVAYLNSFFFQKAFQLIDPEQNTVTLHKAPKEALFIDEEHRTEPESFYQESTFSNLEWNRQAYTGKSAKTGQEKTAEQ
jgi:uncharacterized membrane protein YesL